ncbi:MAG: TIGR02281 family clan AA aspartic protease [Rhizobiaceae bacterium]
MGKFFWGMIGLLGLLLIILIASGDTGTTLGFETNQFAVVAVSALWAVLIGTALIGRSGGLIQVLRQLGIWVLIILALMATYVFRFDLQDIASRFSGGIIPGSPISSTNDDGLTVVTLIRSENDHFEATAGVNGKTIRFLVDTGASSVVLSAEDAQLAGLNPASLDYSVRTQTANGTGRAARATVNNLYLGGIERKNFPVLVAQPGRLGQSLLGQQFLESLHSYEKRGDRLTLRD